MRHDVYNLKDKRESEPWCIMYAFNAVKKKKKSLGRVAGRPLRDEGVMNST